MDCHKAMELGFADGILEKQDSPAVSGFAPVMFSQKAVDTALVNRLAAADDGMCRNHFDHAGYSNHADGAYSPGFIPVSPLYERLERLKQ